MEHKLVQAHDLKLDASGAVRVAFAQLNVVDRDGDVTLPGAFPSKDVPMSGYGHSSWSGGLPTGRGRIAEQGEWAIFDGRFFLETAAGRDTYETVKGMAELQEWSYGYDPLGYEFGAHDGQDVRFLKELEVFEVSPVLIGAGIGTRTLDIKSRKSAIASHSSATSDGPWDAAENEANLSNDAGAAVFRTAAAWIDVEADPDTKAAYKFWHHEVSAAGRVGAANLIACSSSVAVLNGGRGGAAIPDSDREGVWRHVARHLRDGDREPPELRSLIPDAGVSLADSVARFLGDGEALALRFAAMADARAKEGRVLSAANRQRLAEIREQIDAILAETDPDKSARAVLVLLEEARFLGVPIGSSAS